jgi:hypothetical protein
MLATERRWWFLLATLLVEDEIAQKFEALTAVRGRRPGPLDECAGVVGTRKVACRFFAVKVGQRRWHEGHSVLTSPSAR